MLSYCFEVKLYCCSRKKWKHDNMCSPDYNMLCKPSSRQMLPLNVNIFSHKKNQFVPRYIFRMPISSQPRWQNLWDENTSSWKSTWYVGPLKFWGTPGIAKISRPYFDSFEFCNLRTWSVSWRTAQQPDSELRVSEMRKRGERTARNILCWKSSLELV